MCKRPVRTLVEESTTHCGWLDVARYQATNVGRVTLRIVASRSMISTVRQRTPRMTARRCPDRSSPMPLESDERQIE